MYNIDFTNYALEDLGKLKKSEPKAFKKVAKSIEELRIHPGRADRHGHGGLLLRFPRQRHDVRSPAGLERQRHPPFRIRT